ncbi:MAG: hypothetical protein J6A75_02185 [Lachnospiraceae bacterium]|nr:hypothetical protein [Lachnospiraceae bacterium]
MKTLVKLINIHDGEESEKQNGDRLYVATYPRAEKIISSFLTNGWKLMSKTQRYTPALQRNECYTFYLGGWDLLFEKEVDDDTEDDSDKILEEALKEIVPQRHTFSVDDLIPAEEYEDDYSDES